MANFFFKANATLYLPKLHFMKNMKKIASFFTIIILLVLLISFKSEEKKQDFKSIMDNYFDDKNSLNPLDATQFGQNEYNDQLPFEMTDGYRKKQASFF